MLSNAVTKLFNGSMFLIWDGSLTKLYLLLTVCYMQTIQLVKHPLERELMFDNGMLT